MLNILVQCAVGTADLPCFTEACKASSRNLCKRRAKLLIWLHIFNRPTRYDEYLVIDTFSILVNCVFRIQF